MFEQFEQLKPLMQNGERYIVVEGGRPEYVVMRFQDYTALASGRRRDNPGHSASPFEVRHADLANVNAELEEVRLREPEPRPDFPAGLGTPGLPADPATVRLEDLPL